MKSHNVETLLLNRFLTYLLTYTLLTSHSKYGGKGKDAKFVGHNLVIV